MLLAPALLMLVMVPATAAQEPVPLDSALTTGTLPNGLTYYIRENRHPVGRAELRLVVNAGSVLEEDGQRGFAHLVEHIAFRSTRRAPAGALVPGLERAGLRFGVDINAHTGFDETVYRLTVPTDRPVLLADAFGILEDWAHGVTFDTAAVRGERGVVIEEWRLGRGADARMDDRLRPTLFHGSRYTARPPIGTVESIENASPDALRRFYNDWYRPDLMAVVAVGDFDARAVERLVREHFGRIPSRRGAPPRPLLAPARRDVAAVSIATDPEATSTHVELLLLRPPSARGTTAGFRDALLARLHTMILNERLSERAAQRRPPFLSAQAGLDRPVRGTQLLAVSASVADRGTRRAWEAVLVEVERVRRHGFTRAEVERAGRRILRELERALAERETTRSAHFATQYVQHFLEAEPIPDRARELALARRVLSSLEVEEVNRNARDWLDVERGRLVVRAPEHSDVPDGDALLALVDDVRHREIAGHRATDPDAPLAAVELPAAAIIDETRDPALGVTTWTLANGARVILKPTQFQADQVLLAAYSPGGSSLVADSLFVAARFAPEVVQASGLGSFSAADLEKRLGDSIVRLETYIDAYHEGMRGEASTRDVGTLLELIYLHFTAPRADRSAFAAQRNRVRAGLAGRKVSPAAAFQDTLDAILAGWHPRGVPPSATAAESLDLKHVLAVYRDRFGDASDFTFILVGSFDVDSVRPLVRRYLGNLPSLQRDERPRDLGIRPPAGTVRQIVRGGIEPISRTSVVFTGSFDDDAVERFHLEALAGVLALRLRRELREERGATYQVSVDATVSRAPRSQYSVAIHFGSAPERADELVDAVFAGIAALRHSGPDESELARVREMMRRERETDMQDNRFWLDHLASAVQSGEPRAGLIELDGLLVTLTAQDLQRAADRYLDPSRHVRVTLLPAE